MSQTPLPCPHCGGDKAIRNPTGTCDHLYYPDYCPMCKQRETKGNCRSCGLNPAAYRQVVEALEVVKRTLTPGTALLTDVLSLRRQIQAALTAAQEAP